MHDLPTQTQNLIGCLYTKVRSDNPQLKRPTVEVEFDLIEVENSSGNMTMHLIARDHRTKSYIYPAESEPNSGEWIAKESEFYGRIYLFIRHLLELFQEENGNLSLEEKGRLVLEIATTEFKKLKKP